MADEVGLGKTMIARGVIAKLANHYRQSGKQLFKVLYICSNTSIANQNIRKLKIYDGITVDGVSDTRLSMQHLKIFEQQQDPKVLEGYIQLIPLTPATSFTLTSGNGNSSERALIYAVLSKMPEFSKYTGKLRAFMTQRATKGFDWWADEMTRRVDVCGEQYLRPLTDEVRVMLTDDLIHSIISDGYESLAKLRLIFAEISIRRLTPDLVIMDEFQRFRELISATPNSDTGMLAQKFLKDSGANTLLLSATPYKLYQTLEEAAESGVDEHYQEFMELMRFLFSDDNRNIQFEETWSDFSKSLRGVNIDFGTRVNIKAKAEKEMYSGMCRTERLLIDGSECFIDCNKTDVPLAVSEMDIQTFIAAESLSESTHIPVEYVKSCPYPLSFMEHYKYKSDIKKQNPEIKPKNRKLLFVDEKKLRSYETLPSNNARLECLINIAFDKSAESLLWVPPSIPYYQPRGVFKGKVCFSKVLVFSAWEMVPRMIACMLSYECERRTIGKLYEKEADKRNKGYLSESMDIGTNLKRRSVTRFPYRKLTDNRMKPIITASEFLAKLYNPVEHMGKSLSAIRKGIRKQIQPLLDSMKHEYRIIERGVSDIDWYWIAPQILDKYIVSNRWPGNEDFKIPQRKMPSDLADVLTSMAIASPATCAMRVFNSDCRLSERFAKEVADMLDKPEAIAAVELAYGKSDDAHYKNVLKYCEDGNFAAMLDEYVHILNDGNVESLCNQMCEALKATTASYSVDSYGSFTDSNKSQIRLRSHFAAGFYQTRGDEKTSQRKENLRTAFNAPFRPFVLATTSIGQEGLDFHNYARKIMHWNLPHNPIDLEQREGRINRYKCLAIRQSLAQKFKGEVFTKGIWNELFQLALDTKINDDPELVPYWCLPEDAAFKIERIVPMYPYSKDKAQYSRLLKILSLYRVTMGQARQEELLEYLFSNCNADELKELFINLSPITKKRHDSPCCNFT
ncbi:helicase C-terminal domain-containing protein [Desulfovibrio sp. QI0430]